jgi:hypothetical protein
MTEQIPGTASFHSIWVQLLFDFMMYGSFRFLNGQLITSKVGTITVKNWGDSVAAQRRA